MQIFFSGAIPTQKELLGITAVLGIIDAETGELLHFCEYETPPELQAPVQRKMQFSGHCLLDDGRVFACCHNEIRGFEEWPPRAPTTRISEPGFNDLHHCIPWKGGLAVANTGLETVDHVSFESELLHRWDLLEGLPDARRIDPDTDYRMIAETTPHTVHGNHLFVRDGELWVTQCKGRRAVCLTAAEPEISFGEGMPHDGRWIGGRLVFTTTRGGLVIVDPDTARDRGHARPRADDAGGEVAGLVPRGVRGPARSEPLLRRLHDLPRNRVTGTSGSGSSTGTRRCRAASTSSTSSDRPEPRAC